MEFTKGSSLGFAKNTTYGFGGIALAARNSCFSGYVDVVGWVICLVRALTSTGMISSRRSITVAEG